MNDDIRNQLPAFCDGALEGPEREAVRRAIEADPDLAREADEIRAQQTLLRETADPKAPDELWDRIAADLPTRRRVIAMPWVARTAGLAAAACLLAIVGLMWPRETDTNTPIDRPRVADTNRGAPEIAEKDFSDLTGLPTRETTLLGVTDRQVMQALYRDALEAAADGDTDKARTTLREIDAFVVELHRRDIALDDTWIRRLSELRVLVNE